MTMLTEKMNNAPIALFVYNRPNHTMKTISNLRENISAKESDLYVFSDGPKKDLDVDGVLAVRGAISNIDGFNSVTVYEEMHNQGLAKSIINGVTKLCESHGKVIVVEDDLLTSPYFLNYMNMALEKYENEDRVMHISGYMFPINDVDMLPESFFLHMTSSWGWATWKRSWDDFEQSAEKLYSRIREDKSGNEFDLSKNYNYMRMLKMQASGKIDSWAIRWYASVFLKNGLGLFPARSYVKNIGFDSSGVHCGNVEVYDVGLSKKNNINMPVELSEHENAKCLLQQYYRDIREPIYKKIYRKLWQIYKRQFK